MSKDMILSTVKLHFTLVCFEDIVEFSKSISDHLSNLHSVLALLNNSNRLFKRARCFFFADKIYYQGHVMKSEKLAILHQVSDAIYWLNQLTKLNELESFLSLSKVFSPFVTNATQIPASLNMTLMKDEQFQFDKFEEMEARALSLLQVVVHHRGSPYWDWSDDIVHIKWHATSKSDSFRF